jgi:hypothetical protein
MNNIFPSLNSYHHSNQRRLTVRHAHASRRVKLSQRIGDKLKKISDSYDTDDMPQRLISGFADHAYKHLDNHISHSSLPDFLKDELQASLPSLNTLSDYNGNSEYKAACDALFAELLPFDDCQLSKLLEETSNLGLNDNKIVDTLESLPEDLENSWSHSLIMIYKGMIAVFMKNNQQKNKKQTPHWLTALALVFADLQVKSLLAAFEDIEAMENSLKFTNIQKNINSENESNTNYSAQQRKSFVSAQSSLQINMMIFRLLTESWITLLSAFKGQSIGQYQLGN